MEIYIDRLDVINNNISSLVDPSEIVKAVIDNAFLLNRMHLFNQNQLSERFRLLKENEYSKGGMWTQAYNSHFNQHTNVYSLREIDSVYTGVKYGFDEIINYLNFNMMTGVHLGYGTLHSNLDKLSGSEINNFSTGMYSAMFWKNGVYLEADFAIDHYKSKISANQAGSFEINSAKFDNLAYSAGFALGRKFYLPNNAFLDAYMDIDFTYYQDHDVKTSNGIRMQQDDYRNLGIMASVLVGQQYNEGKSMVYLKTDFGQYFSDAKNQGKLQDPLTGNWDYKIADYSHAFANAIIGFKAKPSNKTEISFEVNRYFMEDMDANYGFRGEFRYLFN
ncbi:autotransporter outer membrane beta-barrel domain-containing protein [Campylobacter lari]|uniref:Autotransporter outer membrane beta-barrel domain-containing protein n=1 Tax=Campylobacter lari TaxID=201 RepID=A0A6L1L1Y4_CAMLA|nr:autotransporter outer membrane beta-barrel domain-containing protein [Campylobacter lari]